jgi:putative oxidoreductase
MGFFKNLSLGAGFLLIVVGLDGSGLGPFLAHPLASTQPYGVHP